MELTDSAAERRELYAALSLLYRKPTEETDYTVLTVLLADALETCGFGEQAEAVGELARSPEERDAVVSDYLALFFGPSKLLAPPYESVYTSRARQVMGPAATRVVEAYRANGYAVDVSFADCPDHVAAELEFVSRLCADELEARESGSSERAARLEAERAHFLHEHLCRWVPSFAEKVGENAETSFWRAVSSVTAAVVEAEARHAAEAPL